MPENRRAYLTVLKERRLWAGVCAPALIGLASQSGAAHRVREHNQPARRLVSHA